MVFGAAAGVFARAYSDPAFQAQCLKELRLEVANKHVGHSIPTGSTDLRLLWLELAVETPGGSILIPAVPSAAQSPFDVAGGAAFDAQIPGADIPAGSRIYRSIFVDATGTQTLAS